MPTLLGGSAMRSGQRASRFGWTRASYEAGTPGGDDEFAFLRDDLRFVAIMQKIGIRPTRSVVWIPTPDGR